MTRSPNQSHTPADEGRKTAIIVTRTRSVPPDPERDQISLALQKQHCEQIAAELGAEIVRAFAAIGGTTEPVVRAVIEEAVQAVEVEGVSYLITTSVDRLTRRPDVLARLGERLTATGAQLLTGHDYGR